MAGEGDPFDPDSRGARIARHWALSLNPLLSRTPPGARHAGLLQVQALYDDALARGMPRAALEPTRRLIAAHLALDAGIVDPMLEPAETARGEGRPIDPPRLWAAGAYAVLALEARLALGDEMDAAARRVVRELAPCAWAPSPGTLLRWRKKLASPDAGAPRDGEHWDILAVGRARFATAAKWQAEPG